MISRKQGFTLVEVLVALGIIGLALPALLLSIQQKLDSVAYLRDKTLAECVAMNKIAEIRIARSLAKVPIPQRATGNVDMAKRTWYWTVERKKTELPGFTRFEVSVRLKDDDKISPVVKMVGFVGEF